MERNLSVHYVYETRRDDRPETSPFSYSNAHNFFLFLKLLPQNLAVL